MKFANLRQNRTCIGLACRCSFSVSISMYRQHNRKMNYGTKINYYHIG